MPGGIRTRIKVCGTTSVADALHAEICGADAIGVVLSSSPRRVSFGEAHAIFRALSPFTLGVAVTRTASEEDLALILALHPGAVQIYHDFSMPELDAVKIFRAVRKGGSIPEDCDAVVVDDSGGNGSRFDPAFAREVVERSSVPVILAGGLTPGNVRMAIDEVKPHGVDVASGVEETPGIKDPAKVAAFVRSCREAGL